MTVHESWAHRTEGRLYVEVHVGVDPHLTLGEAHDQVDELERELYRRLPDVYEVLTHIEMAARQVEEGDRLPPDLEERLKREIELVVGQMPELAQPHNIAVRRNRNSQDGYYVSLECMIAADTPVGEAHHLSKVLEGELSRHQAGNDCHTLVGLAITIANELPLVSGSLDRFAVRQLASELAEQMLAALTAEAEAAQHADGASGARPPSH